MFRNIVLPCIRYLGVAFSGLRGKTLFPIVSSVWGHCEVRSNFQVQYNTRSRWRWDTLAAQLGTLPPSPPAAEGPSGECAAGLQMWFSKQESYSFPNRCFQECRGQWGGGEGWHVQAGIAKHHQRLPQLPVDPPRLLSSSRMGGKHQPPQEQQASKGFWTRNWSETCDMYLMLDFLLDEMNLGGSRIFTSEPGWPIHHLINC